MIAWQEALTYGLVIIINVIGIVAYVHTRFASKADVKMLIDLGASRFDALKDAIAAVDRNVSRTEARTSELDETLKRILLSRHGSSHDR